MASVRVRYVGMCPWEIWFWLELGEVADVRVSEKLDLRFTLSWAYLKGILRNPVPSPGLEIGLSVCNAYGQDNATVTVWIYL